MSSVPNDIEKENLGFIQIEQKSKDAVAAIQKQLDSLKQLLDSRKREIPYLEQCVVEAKKKREEVEKLADAELEKLFPTKCVLVPSNHLEPVTSTFSFSFLRSYKLSDKTFTTLDYPNPTESIELKQNEDDAQNQLTKGERELAAIRKLFNEAIRSQPPLSDTKVIRLQTPFTQSDISFYHHHLREVEDLPQENEKEEELVIFDDDDDFISLSPSTPSLQEPLFDTVVHLLATTEEEEKTVRYELRKPCPRLYSFPISKALNHVIQCLENDQTDIVTWILYIKLFYSFAIDFRETTLEAILDSCLENVTDKKEMKQWISQWIHIVGCSDRIQTKYSNETPIKNETPIFQTNSCSIENSMHVLYERLIHPSEVGIDVSLAEDVNHALHENCSCKQANHQNYFSVLFFLKRRIEGKNHAVQDWIDYVMKLPEEEAVTLSKKRDYFRSDEEQLNQETNWLQPITFAIPFIVPILTLSEICILRKTLFSRIRKFYHCKNKQISAVMEPPEFDELTSLILQYFPSISVIPISKATLWLLPKCLELWDWQKMDWKNLYRWVRSWVRSDFEWRNEDSEEKRLLVLLHLAMEFHFNGYEKFCKELNEVMSVMRGDEWMWSWYIELIMNFNCFRFTTPYLDGICKILVNRQLYIKELALESSNVCLINHSNYNNKQ